MVTDEERDYMYAEYAKDPRMKLNLGIRRRLAPLLDNGRDEIELMTAILFSLPGSPVLYYGDEIGMGDNIYLGDRDGVRTPMQWTGDRNGGFSRADFAQLYLPPLDGPRLRLPGGERRGAAADADVAAALAAPLHRAAQGASGLRARHLRAAARREPAIFAHVRRYEDDIVLCVHNLARSAQAVELDLRRFDGLVPEEMFGRTRFPRDRRAARTCSRSRRAGSSGSSCRTDAMIEERCSPGDLEFVGEGALLEFVRRPALVRREGGGGRARDGARRRRRCARQPPLLVAALVEIRFQSGTHDLYQLLLGFRPRRRTAGRTDVDRGRRGLGRLRRARATPRSRASSST